MQLHTSIENHTLVINLYGDIDMSVTENLRSTLEEKLDNEPVSNLLIDLSNVEFIDSSGLGVILGRYNRITRSGGKVILTGLKPQVRNVMELSGLLRIMEEYSSTGEALSNIS
ncbi:MAG: anti-sigma factor antagonist [Clostridiales bacterium]|nr:anti-sigma factor antagonist [Clostridiales bacterium]MCF8021211.1 anti-sigma factor antagonist [Clostridiales bacterium]